LAEKNRFNFSFI